MLTTVKHTFTDVKPTDTFTTVKHYHVQLWKIMSFACLNVILAICQKVGKQLSTKLIFFVRVRFFCFQQKGGKTT